MKLLFSLVFYFIVFSILLSQDIPLPKNYSLIDTVTGDLDKDGIRELAVVYNMTETGDPAESIPRELIIYKYQDGHWKTWKTSLQALYGSRDGGMMGDPFEEISIEKGILSISHFGGSSWKWGHVDKYRFQNGEFYLIGYTSSSGKTCEHWLTVDFNISTGKMEVKKEYEQCEDDSQDIYKEENETLIKKGILITLQNRMDKKFKIITPQYGHEIYL